MNIIYIPKKIPEIDFPKSKILTGELHFCSFGLAPVLFLEYFDIKLVERVKKSVVAKSIDLIVYYIPKSIPKD